MNISYSSYPGRYLMPEPMTDPPWILPAISGHGPPIREGPS